MNKNHKKQAGRRGVISTLLMPISTHRRRVAVEIAEVVAAITFKF